MVNKFEKNGTIMMVKNELLGEYLKRKLETVAKPQFGFVKKHLPLERKVFLEIGSFNGLLTNLINSETSSKCFALDINFCVEGKNIIKYDGKIFPFQNRSIDCFTCFEVVEHLENQRFFFKELGRVCKTGAVGLLSTPNGKMVCGLMGGHNSVEYFLKRFFNIEKDCVCLFSKKELVFLVESNGFKVIDLNNRFFQRGFRFLLYKI